jgi:hypothetical protein
VRHGTAGSRHPFIGPGKERRGWKGGGQPAAGVGFMVFNGEMLLRIDTGPRGEEPGGRSWESKWRQCRTAWLH